MEGWKRRALGASLATAAGLGLVPAAQAAVNVTQISSLAAGAQAGNLTGLVRNDGDRAMQSTVSVRAMRNATGGALVGRTTVSVPAHGAKEFLVDVKIPSTLKKGTYYLAACAPQGRGDAGPARLRHRAEERGRSRAATGCAATWPTRRSTSSTAADKAHASQAQCTPGPRTLSSPGNKVWPELGNGGYQSIHTDVFTVYDAPTDKFLPGTHVDEQEKATQCLSNFGLDFDTSNNISPTAATPGPNMTIQSITINGVPATWEQKQPTYAGDPNGDDDPDPLAHQASNTNPVVATNPNPPACAPINNNASSQGAACGKTKLVITPAQPIPAGTNFTVSIAYVGQPGIRSNPSLGNEGWFKNNSPAGEGAMVTDEPSGTMAWMPLNDQASVKPTYDIHTTINYDPSLPNPDTANRVAIGNGRLVSTVVNAPDANFPSGGSRTFNWHSTEPVNSYLVENSVGHFDMSERNAGDILYYEYQGSNIAAAKKVSNQAIMDQQQSFTDFDAAQVNGAFPFNADGVVVASPSASFEEEMQTKIVFVGGSITAQTLTHENMHQWWGDAVSYQEPQVHVLQGGLRRLLGVAVPGEHRRPGRRSRGFARIQDGVRGLDREPLQREHDLAAVTVRQHEHVVLERRAGQPELGQPVLHGEHLHPPGHGLRRAALHPRPGQLQGRQHRDPDELQVRLDQPAAADRDLQEVHAEQVDRVHEQARRVLQAVVGHGLLRQPGGRQQAVHHGPGPGRRRLL